MPTWLAEQAGLLLSLAFVAIIIGGIAVIVRVARQERHTEQTQQTYNNLRAGTWVTVGTLMLGVFVMLSVIAFVGAAVDSFLEAAWDIKDYNDLLLLRLIIDAGVGALPAMPLFVYGLFKIEPGQKAFLKILGVPFGRLGAGYGWLLPGLMEIVYVQTQAHQNSSDGVEEYVTGNGIEMFISSGVTVVVQDPLLLQAISGGDVQSYIDTERQAAVRSYVASKRVDIVLAPDEKTDLKSLETFFNQLKEMKGDIAAGGPESIRREFNERIKAFGLFCTRVQLEKILFNDMLEQSAQRFFSEMMESVGLVQDAVNKTNVIKELITRTLEDVGLKISDLDKHEKLEQVRRGIGFSLAAERQGNYNFVDFGATAPSGVIVNAGGTPPPPANQP